MFRSTRILAAAAALTATLSLAAATLAAAAMPTIGGTWSAIAPLPSSVVPMTAIGGADGRIYVFGFCQGTCHQTGGNVGYGAAVTYVFDPSDGAWHPRRPAPASCASAMASALRSDGHIRLAGCWQDLVSDAGFRIATYDPEHNSWVLEPGHGPYVDPIAGMTAADGRTLWFSETLRNEGSAVFISGHRVVVEDADGGWHSRAKEPKGGPSDGAALGADGRVYAAGGSRECHPDLGACAMPPVEAWTEDTNAWTKPTVLPTSRIRVAVTADARGRIFTIGGIAADGSRLFSRVEVYRPLKGTWARAAQLPDARFAAIAASTPDGRVWVVGGYDRFGSPVYEGYVFAPGS